MTALYIELLEELQTFKGLNIAALNQRAAPCLYMYYLLRHLDKSGKGYVDYTEFIKCITRFGLTRNVFYNALEHEQSYKFFTYNKEQGIILYNSLVKVCVALETTPDITVYLKFLNIRNLKEFKAHIYSTLFVSKKSRKSWIERNTIQEHVNLSKPTQREYERINKTKTEFNAASIIIPNSMKYLPTETIVEKMNLPCNDGRPYYRKGNFIFWQSANTYYIENTKVYKGKSHRANKIVKKLIAGFVSNDLAGRANAITKVCFDNFNDVSMFTDQASSYARTNHIVEIKGRKAQTLRLNNFAPTKNANIAVPVNYNRDSKTIFKKDDSVLPNTKMLNQIKNGVFNATQN